MGLGSIHRSRYFESRSMRNRRKHFLIDKRLQLHYVFYIVLTLSIVSAVGMMGSYFGIWGSALKIFSEESLRETLVTAAQLNEYEQARHPMVKPSPLASLRAYQETSLLSERQKELVKQVMDETNQKMLGLGALLLIFIGWGSIFLTHKIAGPLFKFGQYFQELASGNLAARIKLRKFDEAHNLESQFNEMAGALDATVAKMKRITRETPREQAFEELKKELAKLKTTSDKI